jgi:hypothetical protein
MRELIKISDSSSLVKDKKSGAVVNIDNEAYRAALLNKKKIQEQSFLLEKIKELEARLNIIEQRINKTNI